MERTYGIRLRPGADLKQAVEAFVQQQAIQAGFIMTAVGSLSQISLRLAAQVEGTVFQGPFEIVSLVGTIAVEGSHLHLAVASSTGQTLGGHVLQGCLIYTTAEIVIGAMPDAVFHRVLDSQTGYRELVIETLET